MILVNLSNFQVINLPNFKVLSLWNCQIWHFWIVWIVQNLISRRLEWLKNYQISTKSSLNFTFWKFLEHIVKCFFLEFGRIFTSLSRNFLLHYLCATVHLLLLNKKVYGGVTLFTVSIVVVVLAFRVGCKQQAASVFFLHRKYLTLRVEEFCRKNLIAKAASTLWC